MGTLVLLPCVDAVVRSHRYDDRQPLLASNGVLHGIDCFVHMGRDSGMDDADLKELRRIVTKAEHVKVLLARFEEVKDAIEPDGFVEINRI